MLTLDFKQAHLFQALATNWKNNIMLQSICFEPTVMHLCKKEQLQLSVKLKTICILLIESQYRKFFISNTTYKENLSIHPSHTILLFVHL